MDTNQLTVYITIASFLVGFFKINIGDLEIQQFIQAVGTLVGLGVIWYNRYKKGDLTLGGFSKEIK